MYKVKCGNIPTKRYFLPIVGIISLLYLEEVRNFIYIPFIVSPACFVLFWNYPKIVYFTNSKPLYYEDLFVDEKKLPNYDVTERIKKKFRKILLWSLIVTNSIFMGGLAEYWFFKIYKLTSYMEIIGITGGIIKVFQFINNFISRLILLCIRRRVKKETYLSKSKNKKRFQRLIFLKRLRSNMWENIKTPRDDANIIKQGNHHIEMVVGKRPRSLTV